MPESDEEGFLLRWSRRKRSAGRKEGAGRPVAGDGLDSDGPGVVAGTPETTAGHVDVGPSGGMAEARRGEGLDQELGEGTGQDAGGAETVPKDLVGVEVEALDYEADFTRFMKHDVPEALKRRALRQLWRSDPILANVDGLNDYDDDFTDAALAVKVLETAHKIGRGYLDDDDAELDEDLDVGGEDGDESKAVRARDEDGAVEPRAGEGDAVSKDETLARVDEADFRDEGKDRVTRTS